MLDICFSSGGKGNAHFWKVVTKRGSMIYKEEGYVPTLYVSMFYLLLEQSGFRKVKRQKETCWIFNINKKWAWFYLVGGKFYKVNSKNASNVSPERFNTVLFQVGNTQNFNSIFELLYYVNTEVHGYLCLAKKVHISGFYCSK